MMIKNAIIVVLLLYVGVLTGICAYQNSTIDNAIEYIEVLEENNLNLEDTIAGTDAYINWYK